MSEPTTVPLFDFTTPLAKLDKLITDRKRKLDNINASVIVGCNKFNRDNTLSVVVVYDPINNRISVRSNGLTIKKFIRLQLLPTNMVLIEGYYKTGDLITESCTLIEVGKYVGRLLTGELMSKVIVDLMISNDWAK